MITINESYLKLQASYLFAEIKNRTAAFQEAHPEREVIKLGIGDVTRPLPPACIQALLPIGGLCGTAGRNYNDIHPLGSRAGHSFDIPAHLSGGITA